MVDHSLDVKMTIEYTLGRRQFRKYIFLPLMKLVAVIVIFTVLSAVWLRVSREDMVMVISLTWSYVGLIHLVPLLVMGIRHSQLSKGAYFSVDATNNQYRYRERDIDLSFNLGEIDKVVKVVSPPKYDKRIDLLGFGYFFYWKVILLDGRTLSISCMLLDTHDFLGKKESLEKRMFPIPPSNRVLRLWRMS